MSEEGSQFNLIKIEGRIEGKPLSKLIDACRAGLGGMTHAWSTPRNARADAEAMVILAQARAAVSDIEHRAASRVLPQEVRRQQNIEAVVSEACRALPQAVSDDTVEADWAARFFREVQDVTSGQMRLLWGKILAGEVTQPGAFSPRTLTVVSALTQAEAAMFESACPFFSRVYGQGCFVLLPDVNSPLVTAAGLGFAAFKKLQAAGLINVESMALSLTFTVTGRPSDVPRVLIERPDNVLLQASPINPMSPDNFPLGQVSLTPAGEELFAIAQWAPIPKHDEAIEQHVKTGRWTVERRRIIQRNPDGTVRHVPESSLSPSPSNR